MYIIKCASEIQNWQIFVVAVAYLAIALYMH